jgi:hypothetical protein
MSIDPAIFRALVAQGATPEMLLAVVEADAAVREEKAAKKRADTAARVRKHRGKGKDGNAGNALHDVTERYAEAAPPNDIYSNPPVTPEIAKAICPPFSEKAVSAWNDGPAAAGATRANALDANRRKLLALRVKEHGEDAVLRAIANLGRSPFHCGKNDRGWRANIGWMLKSPENFMKALEMSGPADAATTAKPMDDEARAAYLAKLQAAPHLRGIATVDPPPRPNGHAGPRGFGQLAAGIASGMAH